MCRRAIPLQLRPSTISPSPIETCQQKRNNPSFQSRRVGEFLSIPREGPDWANGQVFLGDTCTGTLSFRSTRFRNLANTPSATLSDPRRSVTACHCRAAGSGQILALPVSKRIHHSRQDEVPRLCAGWEFGLVGFSPFPFSVRPKSSIDPQRRRQRKLESSSFRTAPDEPANS